MTNVEIFRAVARGDMTPEQGAKIMMQERETHTMKTAIWNFIKTLNRNQAMLIIGLIVAEGPDVAAVANFLASSGIPHLTGAVHFLGWLSTALASAAIAWPRIRNRLSSLGLTTAPGTLAPWIPGKPGEPNVIPLLDGSSVVQVKAPTQAGEPSLAQVAMDPSQVATNKASVISMAPMPTPSDEDVITRPITPKGVVFKTTFPPK